MALPQKEKLEGLIGLRDIVCGIRVFNRDVGHCSDGILDSKFLATEVLFSGDCVGREDRISISIAYATRATLFNRVAFLRKLQLVNSLYSAILVTIFGTIDMQQQTYEI